jgi:hypothetical protein
MRCMGESLGGVRSYGCGTCARPHLPDVHGSTAYAQAAMQHETQCMHMCFLTNQIKVCTPNMSADTLSSLRSVWRLLCCLTEHPDHLVTL